MKWSGVAGCCGGILSSLHSPWEREPPSCPHQRAMSGAAGSSWLGRPTQSCPGMQSEGEVRVRVESQGPSKGEGTVGTKNKGVRRSWKGWKEAEGSRKQVWMLICVARSTFKSFKFTCAERQSGDRCTRLSADRHMV